MKKGAAHRVAFTGLLFALAIALSWVESLVSPLLGLPPGVKLGLANIVVMYALLFLSRTQALALALLKALFGLLTRGPTAGLLSLAGGVASFVVMALLLLPKKNRASMLLVAVAGSVAHNMGQLLVAYFLLGSAMLYYTPVLLLSGVGMGVLTSLTLRVLLPALEKAGIVKPGDSR